MYIYIIYAWERKWIRPVSKWPSPRNLTSWNSPFSFISEGSFGRRRSRARSLIRPGFAIIICVKMHQKKQTKTPSVPHLPREVHHFVHCRQVEPDRENFKPAKWRSIADFQKVSKEKGRIEGFLKTSPKVKGKVTTPVSRSMLIRAPTPRDPDGSKILFLGK